MTETDNSTLSNEETQAPEGQLDGTESNEPDSSDEETTEVTEVEETEETEEEESTDEEKQTLLAGKFKSVDDLEKSYSELQKKLGSRDEDKELKQQLSNLYGNEKPSAIKAEEVLNDVPADIREEMISDFRKRKNEQIQKEIQAKSEQYFEQDAENHPEIKSFKKTLLGLSMLSENRGKLYSEIYNDNKEELGVSTNRSIDQRKKGATAIGGTTGQAKGGSKQFTQKQIAQMSPKEFAKNEKAIKQWYMDQKK